MMSYAPEPIHRIPCLLAPERSKAIKNLRMIADHIEQGFNGFDFLVGYDFINLPFDVEAGEQKRKAGD